MLTDGLERCGLLWGFYQLTLILTAPIHCRAAHIIFHFWVNYSFNGLAFCHPTFLSEDIIDIGQKLWFHLSNIIGQAMDAMHMVTALCFFLWKNEWMYLFSVWLCIVVHPKGGCVSAQPPPVVPYARKVNWFHKACSKTYSWLDRVLQSDLPQMMLSAVWNKSQPPVSGCKSWNIPPPPASCASASLLGSDSDTFCWTWRSRSMWANLEINTPAWVSSLDRSINTMRCHQDLTSGVWTRLVEKKGRCNRFVIPALVLRRIRGRCDVELSL